MFSDPATPHNRVVWPYVYAEDQKQADISGAARSAKLLGLNTNSEHSSVS